MLYLKLKQGKHILVLEPGNVQKLKEGEIVFSPNKEVMLAYTPDPAWFKEQLKGTIFKGFDVEEFDRIHKESMSRKEVSDYPYFSLEEIPTDLTEGNKRKC